MSGTFTTVSAPQGFFQNDTVTPATIQDLVATVTAAQAAAANAETQATAAAAAAASAASQVTAAAASASAAASSQTAAASSATAAASSASAAATSSTAAANNANAASTYQTNAASSASSAATSASNAASSQTAAANSATSAGSYAASASGSLAAVNGAMQGMSFRNKLHNSLFRVWQRGTGPFTTLNSYTADRWWMTGVTDTLSISQVALTDTDRSLIGDEEAQLGLAATFTGSSASGAHSNVTQRIESTSRLSNKTMTVSFWAKAASGTPKVGVNINQVFGSGGSGAYSSAVSVVTLATTWARYTTTFALPSIAGKTIGAGDYTEVSITFSSGAGGSIPTQSGTVTLWGLQAEVNSVVTPLEKPDLTFDLENCQRFFWTGQVVANATASWGSGSYLFLNVSPHVPMRTNPTVTYSLAGETNISSSSVYAATADFISIECLTTVAAGTVFAASVATFTASADL